MIKPCSDAIPSEISDGRTARFRIRIHQNGLEQMVTEPFGPSSRIVRGERYCREHLETMQLERRDQISYREAFPSSQSLLYLQYAECNNNNNKFYLLYRYLFLVHCSTGERRPAVQYAECNSSKFK
jgi:hypothetical protein